MNRLPYCVCTPVQISAQFNEDWEAIEADTPLEPDPGTKDHPPVLPQQQIFAVVPVPPEEQAAINRVRMMCAKTIVVVVLRGAQR